MTSLSATALVVNAEQHIRQGDAHAGIAILEQVKRTFQTANAPKARKAERSSKQKIKELSDNPRTALNVGPCATRKEIKKSYRKLALKYHPDKNQYTEDLFKVIQTAYDQIKDQPTPAKAPAPRRTSNNSRQAHYKQYYQQQQQQQQQNHHHQNQQNRQNRAPSKPNTHKSHRSRRARQHRHHRHHRPAHDEKENTRPCSQHNKPPRGASNGTTDKATERAEKEMNDFWTSGGKHFPFKFCRENPEAAAAMFARMFRGGAIPTTNADATYEAFRKAFEKRGYGGKQQKQKGQEIPRTPPAIRQVVDLRVLNGQIKKDSVALMWKAADGAICYELRYKRTRDREWKTSSDSLRTSACRKNNLLPGTHYDFCVRAKFGPNGIWGPTSKPCTVRTISTVPDICIMRDVIEPSDDSVRIRWRAPDSNGSEIIGYELQWKHWGAEVWKSANNLISGTECRKKNLLPGRRYEFRVRCKNNIGFGPFAAGVSGSTTNSKKKEQQEAAAAEAYARARADEKVQKAHQAKKMKKEKKKKKKYSRPRPNGPPPPASPQAKPPTSESSSNPFTPASAYPEVDLWYKMKDDLGHDYWWSESTGSVWDGPSWIDHFDSNHNSYYYEHRVTGHTTWKKPDDFVPIIPGS